MKKKKFYRPLLFKHSTLTVHSLTHSIFTEGLEDKKKKANRNSEVESNTPHAWNSPSNGETGTLQENAK